MKSSIRTDLFRPRVAAKEVAAIRQTEAGERGRNRAYSLVIMGPTMVVHQEPQCFFVIDSVDLDVHLDAF